MTWTSVHHVDSCQLMLASITRNKDIKQEDPAALDQLLLRMLYRLTLQRTWTSHRMRGLFVATATTRTTER